MRAALVSALLATAFSSRPSAPIAVDPVPALNATLYLGTWFQIYSDLFEVFIETKWCVQADYGLNPNGTVSVWNRERQDSVTGPVKQILGWADRSDPVKAPAELNVYLQGVPIAAPYWVVGLGPPTYGNDGLYEFAIVSDPFELSLFVLARNVTEYYTRWNATVWNLLDTLGFTGLNSPIPTVWDGCTPFKA